MKKTSTRIVAFLLLFAMLLGSFGTITAFAGEGTQDEDPKGSITVNLKDDTNQDVSLADAKLDAYLGEDQNKTDLDAVDVTTEQKLTLKFKDDSDYVFTDNTNKKEVTIEAYKEDGAEDNSTKIKWVKVGEKYTVTVEQKIKLKPLKKGTLSINFTSKEAKFDPSDVKALSITLDGVPFTDEEIKALEKKNVEIKPSMTLIVKMEEGRTHVFSDGSISKETVIKKGAWGSGEELKYEFSAEVKKAESDTNKIRAKYSFPKGVDRLMNIGSQTLPFSGRLVEKGKEYEITGSMLTGEKLIIDPIKGDENLKIVGGKIIFTAPEDVNDGSEVKLNLAIQKDIGEYIVKADARAGKTTIALELKDTPEKLGIDSIYGKYNGKLGSKKSDTINGKTEIVYLIDEIKKEGETITLYTQLADGAFLPLKDIQSEFINIKLEVDKVKAGEKKVTGKTAPDAEVFITREGFDEPIKTDADKEGKFEANVVTTLKGKEVFHVYATIGEKYKSDIIEVIVPEDEVVNKSSRVSGKDRYLTAVEVSKAYFPVNSDIKPKTVIIAEGENEADALAAGPLSIKHGAPILLVQKDKIPAQVLAEINRLNPQNLIIVGGKSSVSEAVENALKATDRTITRLAGKNRFETSLEVAKSIKAGFPMKGIILANGYNSVDALAVSGYAAKNNLAVVLTAKEALPQEVKAYIESASIDHVEIVGGNNSVASAVETELGDLFKVRTKGSDRYMTALELAKKAYPEAKKAIFVNAFKPVDALSAAPYAFKNDMPILLVNKVTIPAGTLEYVKDNDINEVVAIGGTGSIAESVLKEFEALNPPKEEAPKETPSETN